jgi:hypothetical protein
MSLMNLTEDKPKCESCEQLKATIAELIEAGKMFMSLPLTGNPADDPPYFRAIDAMGAAIAKVEGEIS